MRSAWLLSLIMFCSLVLQDAVYAQDKLAVPDEAERAQAKKLVLEIYGDQIERAAGAEQKAQLCAKLLEEADNLSEAASKYALMEAALDHAPTVDVALQAVNAIASSFQIEPLTTKASAIWKMSKKAKSLSQHKMVAEAALSIIEAAARDDAFELAEKLAKIAESSAGKSKDFKLLRAVRKKSSELKKQQADFQVVQQALKVLGKDPTNAEANVTVGKYWIFAKGDWQKGLPMLALGDDDALRAIAKLELKMPTSGKDQLAVADAWYQLAGESDDATKATLMRRAGHWYESSLTAEPKVTGLDRAKVNKRLKSIGPLAASTKDTAVPRRKTRTLGDRYQKTVLRHTITGHDGVVSTVEFSPNGKAVMSASKGRLVEGVWRGDKTIRLWDVKTGRKVTEVAGITSSIRAATFARDGRHVITGDGASRVRVWDLNSGKVVYRLDGHEGAVEGIALSPDGNRIASASTDNTVAIWQAATRQRVLSIPAHTDRAYTVSYSPKAELVASGSRDRTVAISDLKTGKVLHRLMGHRRSVTCVAFSPNGETLASCSTDGSIRLWSVKTGEQRRVLDDHTDSVVGVVYSPDGSMLASASGDKTVRLWDANGLRDTLVGHADAVRSVAFSSDGKLLASASSDGQVLIWEITSAAR